MGPDDERLAGATRVLDPEPDASVAPDRGAIGDYPAPGETTTTRRRASWFTALIALVALTPLVAGAVSLVRTASSSTGLFGDRAVIALTAADVWRTPVLLGPYSRFYWHHPGPLYFYVLGVWSSLFGGSTLGLELGATAINLAAAAAVLLIARRRGGRPLVCWTALLLVALLIAMGPVAFDVWNPSVTLLPFALTLLLAWCVACLDWWALPWLVLTGSFAVQTHVGLAPGVMTALVLAVGVGLWRRRRRVACGREDAPRSMRRWMWVSVAVGAVLWLPPLIQQVTSSDGNLTALARFFLHSGTEHSLSDGFLNTVLQATLPLRAVFEPVTLRSDLHQGVGWAGLVVFGAFALALWSAVRTRATDIVVLLALVAIELVVGVYSTTRIVGPIVFYLVQWIAAVGFVLLIVAGAAAILAFRGRLQALPSARTMTVAGAGLLAVLVCAGAVRASSFDVRGDTEDLSAAKSHALFGAVPVGRLLAATRGEPTVVLRLDDESAWEILAADALELEQRGKEVRILDSPVTRLLFDHARLVGSAPQAGVLVFREQAKASTRPGDASTEVAHQGRWEIVRVG